MAHTKCLVCNCEKTMPLDEKKLASTLNDAFDEGISSGFTSLCRAQISSFENAISEDGTLVVACTQEAPLFLEISEETGQEKDLRFVNIRETAGWSKDAKSAHPKIAALLQDALFQPAPARLKSITSDGMCLVYGSGENAVEIARILSGSLSVSLLLDDTEKFPLTTLGDIPVYSGRITSTQGSFGAFEVTVDDYAPLRPSSRGEASFGVPRNNARTSCSLIFDMSGNAPLITGHRKRDGYVHVDPGDPAAALRAAVGLMDMVGEFEKPIYVDYNAETCAHSRSQKTGCNKCLDVCPAGAISDEGEQVSIDNGICGGCGSCHAVCPTGSISYQYPSRSDIIDRCRHLLNAYMTAKGKEPVLLLHDEAHGVQMISAVARFYDGLPANVIPVAMHSVSVAGHVELLGMIASGAATVVVLANPEFEDELEGLESEVALGIAILSGLHPDDAQRLELLCEADPEVVNEKLWALQRRKSIAAKSFEPAGNKRDMARLVLTNLHSGSTKKPDTIALPDNAPYGNVVIDQQACTLCMACTSACPASAIIDTPGEPRLRFTEAACVQCGLCVRTCPESALSLEPRFDFTANAMQPRTLYEEEPFDCISCGKPFATRSTIERITTQLAGKHSMFENEERSNLIKMCENCRVEAQANASDNPFEAGKRPRPRTTEDYLAAENGDLSPDDFLIED